MPTRLEGSYARSRRQIEAEAQRLLRRSWLTASEEQFLEEAIAIEGAARTATVSATDAFLTAALVASGVATSPVGLDADAYRRPVDPETLWGRPHKHMRIKQSEGVAFPEASRFGARMADTLLATDMQFAARGASRDRVVSEPSATGYRRVTTSSKPCGLCIAASDQLYYVETLMPIHDSCHCTVKPVSLERRYGLSDGEYQKVIEQTGGDTSAQALSRVRLGDEIPADATPFLVVEHGELGPYMFDATHTPPLLDAAA